MQFNNLIHHDTVSIQYEFTGIGYIIATLILTRSRVYICVRNNISIFSSRGIYIDYRSAESIGIRIVLYLKRTFNEDLAECLNLWSIRGIYIFNNLMSFYNNMRHN